jgi:hypothetical protein
MHKLLQQVMLLGCLLFGGMQLQAQATLSVQGNIIQNFTGAAIDNGSYDITFKLYTTDAGGTPIWTEVQSVNMIGGVYSVVLGAVNPLNVPFDQPYYLGLTLPGGPEHTPRAQLTSAPYALSLLGQDNKFPSTGNVGIGTTDPKTTLDANGSISTATVTTSAAAYTVLAADHVIFLDLAGAQAVTLPSAVTFPRREIVLINKTSTAKTVSSYVDLAGAAATAIPANGMIELRSNGTEWRLATTFAPTATAAKAFVQCYPVVSTIPFGTNFTILYTETSDAQNCFANNTFTAPRTGIYHCSGWSYVNTTYGTGTDIVDYTIRSGGTAGGNLPRISKRNYALFGKDLWINFSFSLAMTAGQTLTLIFQATGSANSSPPTQLGGAQAIDSGVMTITEN